MYLKKHYRRCSNKTATLTNRKVLNKMHFKATGFKTPPRRHSYQPGSKDAAGKEELQIKDAQDT